MEPTVTFIDEKVVTRKEREVVIGKWRKKKNQSKGNGYRGRAVGSIR